MSLDNNRSSCIYTERPQKEKIALVLTDKLLNQINFLHSKIGATEWSGILLYKVLSGDISEPESLILQADWIYPMDIGSSTYTEFDYDDAYIEMHEKIEIIQDGKRVYKIGTIHTHHTMGTFFSGTDTGELHTNSAKHNFYLSLIVNHACDYKAKIAMHAAAGETIYSLKGSSGNIIKSLPGNDALFIYDCDIQTEQETWFLERFSQLKAKPKPVYVQPYASNIKTYPAVNNDYYEKNYGYSNQGHLDFGKKYNDKTEKKTHEKSPNLLRKEKDVEWGKSLESLCSSISGDLKCYIDIYNLMKRLQTLITEAKDKILIEAEITNQARRISKNFTIYCDNVLGRKAGVFELDYYATETRNYFDTYTFNGMDYAKRAVREALEEHMLKEVN